MPTTGTAAPAACLSLAGLLGDTGVVSADSNGLAAVAPMGRHEPYGAVSMPVVVLVHECHHSCAGLFLSAEGPPGIVRPE